MFAPEALGVYAFYATTTNGFGEISITLHDDPDDQEALAPNPKFD